MAVGNVQAIVFDLDGTLANTAGLATGMRMPALVLSRARPGQGSRTLSFGDEVCALPAKLLAAGFRVAIMTRAPRAYASTLIALLRLDTEVLAASANETTLGRVCAMLEVEPPAVLYVGDQPQDEAWAARCGVQFLTCPWQAGAIDVSGFPLLPPPEQPFGLDEVVSRLRSGRASDSDYQFLESGGFLSVLRQAGDPHRLRTDAARAACLSKEPPWALCKDGHWAETVRTKDVRRALDMYRTFLASRLPDPEFDEACQWVADHRGTGMLSEVFDGLPANLGAKIRRPDTWRDGQRAGRSAPRPRDPRHSDADGRVVVSSWLKARDAHDVQARRAAQLALLDSVDSTWRECILGGEFAPVPRALSWGEADTDPELSIALRSALKRCFPLVKCPRLDAQAVVSYLSDWGQRMARAKNWTGMSGPSVALNLIEMPARVLAAHAEDVADDVVITFVPPTSWRPTQPGEVSARLAYLVAELSGRSCERLLVKRGTQILCDRPGHRRVVLIEDQVTYGTNISAAIRELTDAGHTVIHAWAWSKSRLPVPGVRCQWEAIRGAHMADLPRCPGHPRTTG